MGILARVFRFFLGATIALIGFVGYLPLFRREPVSSAVTAVTTEYYKKVDISPKAYTTSEKRAHLSEDKYQDFHRYINQESDQARYQKEDAKRRNNTKSNSIGVWGKIGPREQVVGIKFKHRF
jgi:hypothetical protein